MRQSRAPKLQWRVLSLLCFLAWGLLASSCRGPAATAGAASAEEDAEAAIRRLLDDQVGAWNDGDIEGFMQGYWQSEALRFASGGDISYGFEPTLERYRERYPDRATMGTLFFEDLDIRQLDAEWALVVGHWRLERSEDQPSGLFTLLLERQQATGGGEPAWRIVHDHTSSASP